MKIWWPPQKIYAGWSCDTCCVWVVNLWSYRRKEKSERKNKKIPLSFPTIKFLHKSMSPRLEVYHAQDLKCLSHPNQFQPNQYNQQLNMPDQDLPASWDTGFSVNGDEKLSITKSVHSCFRQFLQQMLLHPYQFLYYPILCNVKRIKADREGKACRKHGFVQSQCGPGDHSRFHPSMLEELLLVFVP